jgi:hypothetical protein
MRSGRGLKGRRRGGRGLEGRRIRYVSIDTKSQTGQIVKGD